MVNTEQSVAAPVAPTVGRAAKAEAPNLGDPDPLRGDMHQPPHGEFPSLQAMTLSHNRTSFDRNGLQFSRVIFDACLLLNWGLSELAWSGCGAGQRRCE